ncbi:hypothetical protein BN1708_001787 [Verticillium longisporum]|nr:hypothetical protein BN1708_001787 [Verticillium longisporum]
MSGIFGTNETKASARVNNLARTGLQPGAHGTVAATDQRRIRWADIPAPSLSNEACHKAASPCAHPLAFKFETACRLISLRAAATAPSHHRTLRISPPPSSARRHAV